MSGQIARPFAWVALFVLVSGGNLAVPANPARADDCRAGPNAPAPAGTHWYYRLDWATQRKCWYVRAPGRRLHQAAAPAIVTPATASRPTSAPPEPTPAADATPMLPNPGDATPPLSASAFRTIDKTHRQSAREEGVTPTTEAPAPQADISSEASAQGAAPPMVAPHDPPIEVASAKAQESAAIPPHTRVDGMSDESENSARSGGSISNGATAMIVFPLLALGLALVGVGSRFLVKHHAARRGRAIQAIIDEPGLDRVKDQGAHQRGDDLQRRESVVEGQELHSFISAVSDQGTSRADGDAIRITREIGKRRHRLAQLRQNIEWMLRSAAGPYGKPLQEQSTV
jgi:hypothetical protein